MQDESTKFHDMGGIKSSVSVSLSAPLWQLPHHVEDDSCFCQSLTMKCADILRFAGECHGIPLIFHKMPRLWFQKLEGCQNTCSLAFLVFNSPKFGPRFQFDDEWPTMPKRRPLARDKRTRAQYLTGWRGGFKFRVSGSEDELEGRIKGMCFWYQHRKHHQNTKKSPKYCFLSSCTNSKHHRNFQRLTALTLR